MRRRYRSEARERPEAVRAAQRVGARVAVLRKERGLTQAQVAERAGLTPEHVSRVENAATSNPGLATLVALAGALGVELRELF